MKKFSLVIICFFAFSQLDGQEITNYTTSEGLLDNFVECLDVDSDDNIWFGTSIGLQMFDGESWIAYNTTDYPGMVHDNIKVIRAMNNGDIWIGTDYGACRFDGLSWTTFDNTNGLNHNIVQSIDEDENGIIWIGTMTGVSYFDGAEWGVFGAPDLHWSGVNVTVSESAENLWLGSPLGGISLYDGDSFTTYFTPSDGLVSPNVTDLLIDDEGNKWIGTDAGISVLDASNINIAQYTQMYQLPPPDTLNQVVDLAMDSEGRIWAGIYVGYLGVGGVAMLDGNEWINYDESDGLIGQNIRGIEIDSFDNVWVATGTGVSKIGSQTSNIYNIEESAISIYPNPSYGKFTISLGGLFQPTTICVYDNQGRAIQNKRFLNSSEVDFEIQGEPGTYLIQFMSGDQSEIIEMVPVIKL
ncbi:MAG: T9SS type A sorting domain-containing protein [Flavobacteriales bacterium]|nr:T9SS type A sorting domain-containing protein [Flavobacteriales bacterium]